MSSKDDIVENNLKTLRKEQGLSIGEVATRLKLTPATIGKLENSEFSDLGAYTYIRGYINHYADLLGVDSKKYLDLIPEKEQKVPLVNTSSSTKTIKFKRQSKNLASYAMGTFLVIALSFSGWYVLKNYTDFAIKNNESEIVDSSELQITPQEELNKSINTDNNSDNYHMSSMIPTQEEQDDSDNSIALPNQTDTENSSFEPETESVETSITQPEIVTEEVSTKVESLAYEIIVEAQEDSWLKVEYLDGKKLHNDILKTGAVNLFSDKPVHFRIGNQNKVKVMINGNEINISKFSRKNIADFNWPVDS